MRKKVIVRKAVKMYTCIGRKLIRVGMCALLVCNMCACSSTSMSAPMFNDPLMQKSWDKFCESYVLDKQNPTEDEINDFLDAWRGSVEEEIAVPEMYE